MLQDLERMPLEQLMYFLRSVRPENVDDNTFVQILALVRSPNREVRRLAYLSLGRSGRKEAIPVLMDALREKFWHFRAAAVTALAELGAVEALGEIRRLAEEDPAFGVRQDAKVALTRLTGWQS